MNLFCKECGVAFSGSAEVCRRCGAPRSSHTTGTPLPKKSKQVTPIEALGITPPVAKVKISETLNDPNFNIKNYYSPDEISAFYPVLDRILDAADIHGTEFVLPALHQLGEAGSSGAWRVLASVSEQNADLEEVERYSSLGVHCAFNNWDVLVSMSTLATALAREIYQAKTDSAWVFQEPHPLGKTVTETSALLRDVIGHLYPNSQELQSYMAEDVENTRHVLAETGKALYNIHQVFGSDGKPPGHAGMMALGLCLLIDFGPIAERASAEEELRNLVTIQGQFSKFADQILEVTIIAPKLKELGVWRWGEETSVNSDTELFAELGVKVVDVDGKPRLLDKDLGIVFLAWFDSPLGVELLDLRVPVLWNVPSKTPALLSLVESFGPFTVGQWIFAGDDDQGYSLTFGVQLSRADLTAKTLSASLDFLKSVHSLGAKVMEEVAANPKKYPNAHGIKFVRGEG